MATHPGDDRAEPGVPTIGFIAHVDTSPEMPRRRREADRPPAATTAATSCCRTIRRRCCGSRTIPALAEQIGHDIVTASGTTLLGADNKAGVAEIVTAAAYLIAHPGDSARPDPDRLHAGRRGRPRHAALRRRGVRRALRLHDGRRQPRRDRDRELLGRRDDRDLPRLQHPPGLRQGADGERDQGGGGVHRRAAARIACRRRPPTATRASSTRTWSRPASSARRSGCWSATS